MQQSAGFMQHPSQVMSAAPMNPQGHQQPQFVPLQQHSAAPVAGAASAVHSGEAEPPAPGMEDGAATKAPAKAVAKPSYSAAPVLHTAATPSAEGATPQV